jgi:L-asparaginase
MPSPHPSIGAEAPRVVILATGGTIAGTASSASDSVGYTAAQLGVDDLVAAVPALAGRALETEQVAQVDSKDMTHAIWRQLAGRVAAHLARAEVAGVVVTHGTDTLEETAYLLQRVLAPAKPVVLTAAMRPATALQADGPQNLLDAVRLATEPGAFGVVAIVAGTVHGAYDLRKTHTLRLDAFGSGDAGPLGCIDAGRLRRLRDWPAGTALGLGVLDAEPWPRVEIVTSHGGADGRIVDALCAQGGVDGIVVAGTGHATLHEQLEAALQRAQAAGVAVRRATRVGAGPLIARRGATWPVSPAATPPQARIELMLELLAARRPGGS